MCYNPEVSIGTFLFVGICCGYLWIRNHSGDRGLAIIFLSIVLMQLVEFFLWFEVDTCSDKNVFLSRLIPYTLWMQPLLILFAAWKFNIGWGAGYRELLLLCLAATPLFMWYESTVKHKCVITGQHGHMVWADSINDFIENSNPIPYFLHILYVLTITYVFITLRNIPLALALGITNIITYIEARIRTNDAWPSVYCHTLNILAVIAILLN